MRLSCTYQMSCSAMSASASRHALCALVALLVPCGVFLMVESRSRLQIAHEYSEAPPILTVSPPRLESKLPRGGARTALSQEFNSTARSAGDLRQNFTPVRGEVSIPGGGRGGAPAVISIAYVGADGKIESLEPIEALEGGFSSEIPAGASLVGVRGVIDGAWLGISLFVVNGVDELVCDLRLRRSREVQIAVIEDSGIPIAGAHIQPGLTTNSIDGDSRRLAKHLGGPATDSNSAGVATVTAFGERQMFSISKPGYSSCNVELSSVTPARVDVTLIAISPVVGVLAGRSELSAPGSDLVVGVFPSASRLDPDGAASSLGSFELGGEFTVSVIVPQGADRSFSLPRIEHGWPILGVRDDSGRLLGLSQYDTSRGGYYAWKDPVESTLEIGVSGRGADDVDRIAAQLRWSEGDTVVSHNMAGIWRPGEVLQLSTGRIWIDSVVDIYLDVGKRMATWEKVRMVPGGNQVFVDQNSAIGTVGVRVLEQGSRAPVDGILVTFKSEHPDSGQLVSVFQVETGEDGVALSGACADGRSIAEIRDSESGYRLAEVTFDASDHGGVPVEVLLAVNDSSLRIGVAPANETAQFYRIGVGRPDSPPSSTCVAWTPRRKGECQLAPWEICAAVVEVGGQVEFGNLPSGEYRAYASPLNGAANDLAVLHCGSLLASTVASDVALVAGEIVQVLLMNVKRSTVHVAIKSTGEGSERMVDEALVYYQACAKLQGGIVRDVSVEPDSAKSLGGGIFMLEEVASQYCLVEVHPRDALGGTFLVECAEGEAVELKVGGWVEVNFSGDSRLGRSAVLRADVVSFAGHLVLPQLLSAAAEFDCSGSGHRRSIWIADPAAQVYLSLIGEVTASGMLSRQDAKPSGVRAKRTIQLHAYGR